MMHAMKFPNDSLFLLETHFSYSKLAFLTRNSLFLLETRFYYSKLAFLTRNSLFVTRNSLFLLETRFSYSKLTFLTRNSLFLLETRFSYSKLAFLTRNSLFLLETRFSYSKLTFLTRNSLFLLETHYLLKVNHVMQWGHKNRNLRVHYSSGKQGSPSFPMELCRFYLTFYFGLVIVFCGWCLKKRVKKKTSRENY